MFPRHPMPTSPFGQFSVQVTVYGSSLSLQYSGLYLTYTVLDYNRGNSTDRIRTVLCPGLGTAVGRMPYKKCAIQVYTPTYRSLPLMLYQYVCLCSCFRCVQHTRQCCMETFLPLILHHLYLTVAQAMLTLYGYVDVLSLVVVYVLKVHSLTEHFTGWWRYSDCFRTHRTERRTICKPIDHEYSLGVHMQWFESLNLVCDFSNFVNFTFNHISFL